MKKFLLKLLCLFTVVFAVLIFGIAVLVFAAPQYKYSYNASLIDKIDFLEKSASPKIILCGNSNLAFGINSKLIENEFCMPVVNLGLHGGLGNAFHEEAAKLNIQTGDILIVCHSSYSDDDKISDPLLAWTTLENNFSLYKILRRKDFFDMAKAFPKYAAKTAMLWLTKKGNRIPADCYTRTGFNENGDLIYPREYDKNLFDGSAHSSVPQINDVCIKRLNRLSEYCTQKNAVLLVAGFPIMQRSGEVLDRSEYENFQTNLEEKLDCRIISGFTDYIYDESLFYNTNLHLTNAGAEIRTKQLINDLQKYFGREQEN
ncbi:MAG: hypothetical protein Q4P16_06500 [Spirochaetales bacterium]|nr:hypothetical protein [Spirochaetales bacterium]